MKKMEFSVDIQASREVVWNTLWNDTSFRDWANNIDEGMYMVGEMEEGADVQFFSGGADYGVRSVIEKLTPKEFVSFRHIADTIEGGKQEREKEWTGGHESYSLTEHDDITTLIVVLDTPPEQEETMQDRMPKALKRIKVLSEDEDGK